MARRARSTIGRLLPPRTVSGIPGRIHFNDFMLTGRSPEEIASYRERALNVIALIEQALGETGQSFDDVRRWLDFGCGYGRVVRFLTQHVPSERISACDVIGEGVDFCRSEFGVRALRSHPDLSRVELCNFDFIYAISVLTHLDERNSEEFIRLIGSSLTPGGIALFTTHGKYSLEHPGLYGPEFESRAVQIERRVVRDGMAFLPYSFQPDSTYGMAWHSTEYVERTVARLHAGHLQLLWHRPAGLDGHQDVFAYVRAPAKEDS